MPRQLSLLARLEKNRSSSTGAWLVLLEIKVKGNTVRICNNTENIIWDGQEWAQFPFDFTDITVEDSKGEKTAVSIKVSNLTGIVMNYIEMSNGENAKVIVRVVHSQHLEESAYFEEELAVNTISYDDYWIELKLSPDFVSTQRIPMHRYMKDFCCWKFKDLECGYNGPETECNKGFKRCRELKNTKRFGGEPLLGGSFYIEE